MMRGGQRKEGCSTSDATTGSPMTAVTPVTTASSNERWCDGAGRVVLSAVWLEMGGFFRFCRLREPLVLVSVCP